LPSKIGPSIFSDVVCASVHARCVRVCAGVCGTVYATSMRPMCCAATLSTVSSPVRGRSAIRCMPCTKNCNSHALLHTTPFPTSCVNFVYACFCVRVHGALANSLDEALPCLKPFVKNNKGYLAILQDRGLEMLEAAAA